MPDRARPRRLTLSALALGCGLLALSPAFAATLNATVDRASIVAGETVEYVLSLTGGDGREPPDLSPLTRDFEVVGQGRRSRNMIVDGKRVQVNEWVLTLAPKKTGKVTIPALSVAGLSAPPVAVQVVPAASGGASGNAVEDRPLFIRTEVGDVSPFVQSEVPISVRIYDSVGLRPGSSWTRPTAQGATFVEQGDQRSYIRTIGKQRYRVTEQGYLMRPQRSGPIEIEPVVLNAKVPGYSSSSPSNDMAQLLGRGGVPTPWLNNTPDFARDVTLKSNPVTVNVKERPAAATGWFLPSRGVTIASRWSQPPDTAKVGETLTRTIRLEARGTAANQLPPIEPAEVPGLRQYEESSRAESRPVQGEAGAILMKTISVVPTRPGAFTLPAIEVPWWNIDTQKQEMVTLPAETFQVQPAAIAQAPAPAPTPSASGTAPPPPTEAPTVTAPPPPADLTARILALLALLSRDRLVALALAVTGVFALALLWTRLRRTKAPPEPSAQAPQAVSRPGKLSAKSARPAAAKPRTLAAAEAALKTACAANDAAAAHRAFLDWLGFVPAPKDQAQPSLAGPMATSAMAEAVEGLCANLYGPALSPWQGRRFLKIWQQEKRARQRTRKPARGARLAPLYPAAR